MIIPPIHPEKALGIEPNWWADPYGASWSFKYKTIPILTISYGFLSVTDWENRYLWLPVTTFHKLLTESATLSQGKYCSSATRKMLCLHDRNVSLRRAFWVLHYKWATTFDMPERMTRFNNSSPFLLWEDYIPSLHTNFSFLLQFFYFFLFHWNSFVIDYTSFVITTWKCV